MWGVLGILAVAVTIFCIDGLKLVKQGDKKELWIFSILLCIGTGLGIAFLQHIELPSPVDWIEVLYRPFRNVLYNPKG
ncbi:hypothetical protein [Paenibacillus guangzhouensis]|uniref:hypothetical protein n=1 Tax=Paenibacillus guangzhouensis TaxID=1473112 RepID=UPI0012675A56|nr:hypothetical protein [Paenibacillus guangzhouensis]